MVGGAWFFLFHIYKNYRLYILPLQPFFMDNLGATRVQVHVLRRRRAELIIIEATTFYLYRDTPWVAIKVFTYDAMKYTV